VAANSIDVVVKGDYNDKDIKRVMRDLGKLQATSQSLGTKVQAMGKQVQKFGDGMARAGKSLTVGVTLPIVGVGVAATKMAMDFDTSMTKMVSLVGLTRDEVDGMRGDIIDMASQYGKSASEAADAMFFITSAGLRGSEAMETLEASLKGAAIGLGDVQTIADLSTSAMNAYGSETLSATEATSILRTAVEQGKLESSALAGAMGEVLPLASALGVGFDEASAAMAAMSRTGTNASQASTQLTAIFSQLVKETPKGRKALEGVGLSYEGIRKQIREEGLLAALQDITKAFGDDTIATAELFGNKRALVGVMDMLGAGAETTKDIFGALAATTAEDLNPALAAAEETTGFKLQKAFATLKNSLIEFGDVIAPFVEQFAAKLTRLGESFQNLSPQMKTVVVTAAAIAAAVGPLLLVFGKLISVAGLVMKVVGGITLAGSVLAIKVIAVVAAIAAIVVAFKLMYDRSASLRKAVGDLIDTVKEIAKTLFNDVVGAFKSVAGTAGDVGSIFDRVAEVAGNVLAGALKVLTGWWKILANGVRVVIKVYEIVFKAFTMAANLMRGILSAAIDFVLNRTGAFGEGLKNMASAVKSAFSTVVSFVVSAFNGAGDALETFINFGIGAVNKMIDAYNKLADLLPNVSRATHIAEFEFTNFGVAINATNAAADHLTDSANQLKYGNQGLIDSARDSHGAMKAQADAAKEADEELTGLDETIGNVGSSTDKTSKKLERWKEMFSEIAGRLKEAREEIQAEYEGMAKTVQDAVMGSLDFSDALPEVDEEGNRVGGTFMDRLNEQAERAVEFARRIRLLIQQGLSPEAITMVVQEGVNAGTKIAGELINGGATAIDETNKLVESTQGAATEIGIFAADTYFGTGLELAKNTEAGFQKRFNKEGKGYKKLNRLMTALSNSLNRTSYIDVVTRYTTQGTPPSTGGKQIQGADGGIVNRPTFALIGEAGPEAVIPLGKSPGNDPLPMIARGGRGAATTINVNVNAGMGTDGAEVGRQVVDALKAYERRNGPVPVKVA